MSMWPNRWSRAWRCLCQTQGLDLGGDASAIALVEYYAPSEWSDVPSLAGFGHAAGPWVGGGLF